MHKDQQATNLANIKVYKEFTSNIARQIQYYFSMANLATDHFLRNLIQNNHKGWVHFQTLLKFNKLQSIFQNQYNFPLSNKQKIHIIQQSLKHSNKLRCAPHGIKIGHKIQWDKQFQRVLYLQGQKIIQNQIIQFLKTLKIEAQQIVFRRGQGWYFIEIDGDKQQSMRQVREALSSHFNIKVLTMEQFFRFQQQLTQILDQANIEQQTKIHEPDRHIIPKKIYEFDGFQTVNKKNNNKSKTKKIKKAQLGDYNLPKLYLTTRNKKTRQQYQKIRAQKIQIWKQKKQQKLLLKQQKMDIENSNIEFRQ